MKKINRIKI